MHFEGWRYRLGDFDICIGRATLKPKQEFKGFVVEIHYHPLDDLLIGQAICMVRRFPTEKFCLHHHKFQTLRVLTRRKL